MFKDSKDGKTHFYEDSCKPPHGCPNCSSKLGEAIRYVEAMDIGTYTLGRFRRQVLKMLRELTQP